MSEPAIALCREQRLQDLLLTADPRCSALYWRLVGEGNASTVTDQVPSIPRGQTLRLDTLMNIFYERHWRDLTDLMTLKLIVETSGACTIRIIRRCPGEPATILIETSPLEGFVRSTLSVPLSSGPAEDAVLFAEIEAIDETARLHGGAWSTDDPPRSAVRLSIVTCSFGREEMLVENLRRMSETIARTPEIGEVLVVHQGQRDLSAFPPFEALRNSSSFAEKLRLVRQDNFGGTGGFARGILESLGAGASHILLLDDDIRIEPAIIERLVALLPYLKTATTIGGQMLELERPTMLHASHETANLRTLRLGNPYAGLDMASSNLAELFGSRHHSDYNAWWFCCIPAATLDRIGLPFPMFLRHDDVEYGIRTRKAGAPAVTMPGLFVWHACYETKNGAASFVYYERRNFMITAALHDEIALVALLRRHWREAWGALQNHHYAYCWALCRAMDDFLAGPAAVFSDIAGRHRQLTADEARFVLLTMTHIRHRTGKQPYASRRLSLLGIRLKRTDSLSATEAKLAATTRTLPVAIVRTSLALILRSARAAAAYRTEAAAYSSSHFWRRLLILPSTPGSSM